MNTNKIILRGGVELVRAQGRWRFSTSESEINSDSLNSLLAKRPIVAAQSTGRRPSWMLCAVESGAILNIGLADLINRPLDERSLWHVRNIEYHAAACVYHCVRLATGYRDACEGAAHIASIPGMDPGPSMSYGGQEDGYFEFDACVTAARRMYEALRAPLWSFFSSSRGQHPKRLSSVLADADLLPPELRTRVERSWREFGAAAKDYRDSVHHYVPVEHGLGTAFMNRIEGGAWAMRLFVPDNPGARSRAEFTYAQQIDALDYCHVLAREIAALASDVVNSIAPKHDTPQPPAG